VAPVRFLLACWLAVFALQSADVFALVAPDGCFEASETTERDDSCPDQGCTRCLCGARIPAPVTTTMTMSLEPPPPCAPPAFLPPATSASPRRILHVPKSA
jgi:hypothetical protein